MKCTPKIKPLVWDCQSRELSLDDSVQMGVGFDWWGWENTRQETVGHNGQRYAVWNDPGSLEYPWSAYGGDDGSFAYRMFRTERDAKAAVDMWSTPATELNDSPVQPQPVALDVSLEKARALHRVWRALNDGDCPKCHKHHAAMEMDRETIDGIACPDCGFHVTDDEIDAIEVMFAPAMDAAVAIFEQWRKSARMPVEDVCPPISEPVPVAVDDIDAFLGRCLAYWENCWISEVSYDPKPYVRKIRDDLHCLRASLRKRDELKSAKPELLEAARSFFSWYNATYQACPSNHPGHPWCKLGSLVDQFGPQEGSARNER